MRRFVLIPLSLLLASCQQPSAIDTFALFIAAIACGGFFLYCHRGDIADARRKREDKKDDSDDDDPPNTGAVLPVT